MTTTVLAVIDDMQALLTKVLPMAAWAGLALLVVVLCCWALLMARPR